MTTGIPNRSTDRTDLTELGVEQLRSRAAAELDRTRRRSAELTDSVGDEDLVAQALRASGKTTYEDALMHLSGDLKPLEGETSTSTFSSPICDFILAVFELDKKNNWLRRQAIVIILQQVLGDTIER